MELARFGPRIGRDFVLYDSSPFHPAPATLFDYAQDVGINVMGVSAKYIDAIAKQFLAPRGPIGSVLRRHSPPAAR